MVLNQQYDSAKTSINSKKLPAIFNKIDFMALSSNGDRPLLIVDYGCGKYWDFTQKKLREMWQDKIYFSYIAADPNFQPYNHNHLEEEVNKWRENFPNGGVVIICSNVLNVIKEDNIIHELKKRLFAITPIVFFSVYEGNRSGIGHESKPGCWQRNQRISEYVDSSCFEIVRRGVLTRIAYEFIK